MDRKGGNVHFVSELHELPEVSVTDDVQAIKNIVEGETGNTEAQLPEEQITHQNFNFAKSAFQSQTEDENM